MALARYESVAVNLAGDVIPNATVEVRRDQPGRPVVPLWADRNGTVPLGNPITTDAEGKFGFHVTGGSYYIRIFTGPSQQPLQQYVRRYQAIGTAAERDVEDLATALEAGTASFPTLVELESFTPTAEGVGGKVMTGEDAGFYHYDIEEGEWVFDRPLFDTLARMVVTGGTADAIQAETATGVADSAVVMLWIEAPGDNSGPVTINGKEVLTASGNSLIAGQWNEGRAYWFSDEGANYKLRTESDVDGIATQVEIWANETLANKNYAEEWAQSDDPISIGAGGDGVNDKSSKAWAGESASSAAEAAGYAAGLNIPPIEPGDAGKLLQVNAEEDGSEWVTSRALVYPGLPAAPVYDAGGRRIGGLADAVVEDDAVNLGVLRRATREYVGFYNGQAGSANYAIGLLRGSSPLTLGRAGLVFPTAEYAATYLDSSGKVAPCAIVVGEEIWLYYEGYDGTRYRIFHERYSLGGEPRQRFVMPVVDNSAIAGAHSVRRPAVLYEPSDVAAPFKMALTHSTATIEGTNVSLATSIDGVNWTILGQAIALGTGWESTYIATTGSLVKDGSAYRIFYGGHNGTSWRGGEASKAAFTPGGWTKNSANPLLNPRGGYSIAITANVVAGSKTVKVANSALFDVGAPVLLWGASANSNEMNTIAAIADGTTLTMQVPFQGGYTTAEGAALSQIHSRSVDPSEVWFEDGKWKMLFTAYQFRPGQLRETVGYAETASLASGFSILPSVWPLPLNIKQQSFDQVSAENVTVVRVR